MTLLADGMRRCHVCKKVKPTSEFGTGRCKICNYEYLKAWRAANPEKRVAQNMKYKFGISMDDYNSMLEHQSGKCAICGTTEPGGRGRWHIDHDHACCPETKFCGMCIRGLLCSNCNIGIGMFNDDTDTLVAAVAYIISHSNVESRKDFHR